MVQPSDDVSDLDVTPSMLMIEDGRVKAQGDQQDACATEDGIIDPLHDEVGDDAYNGQPTLKVPKNALRRSIRDSKSSLRYSTNEFVLLNDGG